MTKEATVNEPGNAQRGITLGEALERRKRTDPRPSYTMSWHRVVNAIGAWQLVSTLTSEHLLDALDSMAVSFSTKTNYLFAFRAFLDDCVRRGECPQNVARQIRPDVPSRELGLANTSAEASTGLREELAWSAMKDAGERPLDREGLDGARACAYCGRRHARQSETCSESCARGFRRRAGGGRTLTVDCDDALRAILDAEMDRMADLGFDVDRVSVARALILRSVKAPAPVEAFAPPPVNPNVVNVECSDEDLCAIDAWVSAVERLGRPSSREHVVRMLIRRGPAAPRGEDLERFRAWRERNASDEPRPVVGAEPHADTSAEPHPETPAEAQLAERVTPRACDAEPAPPVALHKVREPAVQSWNPSALDAKIAATAKSWTTTGRLA